jgi:hypothetical protein
VPIGNQDRRSIPGTVAPTASRRLDQLLDLLRRQVLARPNVGVVGSLRRYCPIYRYWRWFDELEFCALRLLLAAILAVSAIKLWSEGETKKVKLTHYPQRFYLALFLVAVWTVLACYRRRWELVGSRASGRLRRLKSVEPEALPKK